MTRINFSTAEAQASKSIKYYAGAAAAIGASPIPGSDAVLLTALQAKMMNDVLSKYGVETSLVDIIQQIIGARVVSMLGKAVAGNLIKLIPGAGSVIGGAINAGVASSITYTLGKCAIKAGRMIAENNWQNTPSMVTHALKQNI